MKRDSVGCQFNFEVDPVVTVNIEGDVHYRNLKSAIEESRPCGMVSAFRSSLGLGPKKEPVILASCTGSRSG